MMTDLKKRAMENKCPACGSKPRQECTEVGTEREANWPRRPWRQDVSWHDQRIGVR